MKRFSFIAAIAVVLTMALGPPALAGPAGGMDLVSITHCEYLGKVEPAQAVSEAADKAALKVIQRIQLHMMAEKVIASALATMGRSWIAPSRDLMEPGIGTSTLQATAKEVGGTGTDS